MSKQIATIEKILAAHIFPDLLHGRTDFDLPHTKAVVHWIKQLIAQIQPQTEPKILIAAAYAHDWGYIGLFDGVDSSDPREIAKRKPLHMERGAKLVGDLLTAQLHDFFTVDQIKLVQHLVLMHDRVEDLKSEEEILIMEADTLGMLDTDLVKPTFSKIDNVRFIDKEIFGRRFKHFQHAYALEIGKQLVEKRLRYYSQLTQ